MHMNVKSGIGIDTLKVRKVCFAHRHLAFQNLQSKF
jgi:hypothetical protein